MFLIYNELNVYLDIYDCAYNAPVTNTVYVVYLAVILIWWFGEFSLVRQI